MAGDVMSVRLWLPRIRVVGVLVDAPEELVVRVCSAVRRPRCPQCGTACAMVHDRRDRRIRDLEVSGRPVMLVFEQRRLVCDGCGGRRFMEDHPAFEGRVTARLARRLVADAQAMTVNAAARRHRVSWKLVNTLVAGWAGLVADRRRRRRCRVLLVDETSMPDRSPTGGEPATAASKEPTTCSRSCAEKPTASPTTPTSKPAASSPHNMNPPNPAALIPQKDEGSKDDVFTVTGGTVTRARRLEPPGNIAWEITVTPSGTADVTVTLPVTTDCANTGAICLTDNRKLSNAAEFTVTRRQQQQGTPLTATTSDVPASHDGSKPITIRLTFSTTPVTGFSYTTMKDDAFAVTGGTITRARRAAPPGDVQWDITITPSGTGDITITLPVTDDCTDTGAICTDDRRKLSAAVELTIPGPG